MSGAITIGGLGSNLDTGAIIDALVKAERIPIDVLEDRKALEQKKITLLGTFRGLVDTLRSKASALSTLGQFLSFKVDTSDATAATIAASSSASAGSHALRVLSVLGTDRWAFDGVADPDVDLDANGGSQIQFTYEGTAYAFDFADPTQTSLHDIAAAINGGTNGGVHADVVQTGPTGGATSWQLVLSAPEGGAARRISAISSTVPGLTLDATGPDASGVAQSANNVTVGSNAVAFVDGLRIERDTNDFSGVLAGVSIDLLTADPAKTVTFTVGADKDAIKGKLQEFVDAYNDVVKFVHDQNTYSEDDGAGGELFGDNALRSISGVLSRTLFGQTAGQVAADVAGYGSLRLVGIESQSDGKLTINAATLDQKLGADLNQFAELFADSDGFDNGGAAVGTPGYYVDLTPDTGLADDLVRALDQVTKAYTDASGNTFKGLFDARTDSLNDQIHHYDDEIEQREFRLDKFQANLEARFAALENLMAQLNSQQAFLSNQIQQSSN